MSAEIVTRAVEAAGGPKVVAGATGKTYQAVLKWMDKGLPRTEWTGETNYAETLERLTKGKFSKAALLKRRSAA